MNFLDCSPSMNTSYVDVADQFYKNPLNWLNKAFHESGQNKSTLPTHIVLFDVLRNVSSVNLNFSCFQAHDALRCCYIDQI